MALMQWHIVTREQFNAGTPVDGNLYFITGENVIYRGTELYTKSMEFYTTTLPTNPAPNRIYVDSATLEGKMWDGNAWHTVIKPLADTVTEDGANPVTGAAVSTFVTQKINEITGSGTVLTGATWDGTEHILTFAKGDSTDVNITLTGLGVSLSFNSTTGVLNLLDAAGEIIGDGVNLGLEKFVHSGEYDEVNKNIILYFDDAKTDKVEIPVGDLVDTYTVEDSATLSLTMVANAIKGAVNISAEADNILTAKEDGLYVPPTDISGKMDKVEGATSGNIPEFDENGNLVDSGKNFEDIIPNVNVFTGASIDEATAGATPKKGDFCIVKKQIGSSTKYEYTAYVHNGTNWEAMDGNYSAENVYFPEDLVTTAAIGNVTLTNGQATIAAAGKNLKEVWNSIFVKEKNPTTTQPSVSFTAFNSGIYEVGTTVTPTYTAKLNAGSYTYGPATGITATSWAISDTESHSATTNSGSFDAITVGDDTNYTITATASYEDGAVPVTNVGNDYTAGQIKAGSKSATTSPIKGYRAGFYGAVTAKGEITSDVIRGLTKTTAAPKAGDTWNVSAPVGAMRVIFAYPATLADVASVKDSNGMDAESKSAFESNLMQLDVEGANGYAAIPYKVYYMDYAQANDTANTWKVTL